MVNPVNDKAWDIGFHKEIGDESNPTYAIVIGGTSQALHVVDAAHAGTDFNVSADSNPSLYIHGSGAPVTEYVKIYTNQTDGYFSVTGANAIIGVPTSADVTLQVNAANEYVFDSTNVSFEANTLGSAGNLTFVSGRTIAGTSLIIDATGTAIRMKATASWATTGTGTVGAVGVLGPAEIGSVSLKSWFKLLDAAGTAVYWLPAYAP